MQITDAIQWQDLSRSSLVTKVTVWYQDKIYLDVQCQPEEDTLQTAETLWEKDCCCDARCDAV